MQSVVPSRILRKWEFSKYYVSNFSKDLLNKIWNDPLFNVQDMNSALYRKVKALDQVHVSSLQNFSELALRDSAVRLMKVAELQCSLNDKNLAIVLLTIELIYNVIPFQVKC